MDHSLSWRVLSDPPLQGFENMARDHALAEELEAGQAVLRLYGWDRPTVSLGRNEPGKRCYDTARARESGLPFVRRPTGGRAVLHSDELTYAVVAPLRSLGSLRQVYERVNEGLMMGLRALGADVELASSTGAVGKPDAGPCFREPAAGEVTAGGRKLIGSAQARIGDGFLQHGSLLLGGDQGALERLRWDEQVIESPATLSGLLGRSPGWDEVTAAIRGGLEEALGGRWTNGAMRGRESATQARLEAIYASDEWTWRV
ncbi:MAG: lipoate--protein ligase family protein [Gemmatimonadota bacterium]|nr:MAG: lipoate--protein ligase family protein [Gemmatimonadota bacterium]